MGTGTFLGVKRPGRGVDHPPPSRADVKERVELYIHFSSGSSWPVLGWALPLDVQSYIHIILLCIYSFVSSIVSCYQLQMFEMNENSLNGFHPKECFFKYT